MDFDLTFLFFCVFFFLAVFVFYFQLDQSRKDPVYKQQQLRAALRKQAAVLLRHFLFFFVSWGLSCLGPRPVDSRHVFSPSAPFCHSSFCSLLVTIFLLLSLFSWTCLTCWRVFEFYVKRASRDPKESLGRPKSVASVEGLEGPSFHVKSQASSVKIARFLSKKVSLCVVFLQENRINRRTRHRQSCNKGGERKFAGPASLACRPLFTPLTPKSFVRRPIQ